MKVLYIEDSVLDFKLMDVYYEIISPSVTLSHAKNREEALEAVRGGVDLILTDIMMGGDDGVSIMEKILEIEPEMKYIVISCVAEREDIKKRLPGAVGYYRKPYNKEEFESLINTIGEYDD